MSTQWEEETGINKDILIPLLFILPNVPDFAVQIDQVLRLLRQ